jgi:hypothetical protein
VSAPTTSRPPAAPTGPRRRRTWVRHLRATLVLVIASALFLGVVYPLSIVGFAELVTPSTANGDLTHNPNGTVNGSSDLPPGTNSTIASPLSPAPVGSQGTTRPGDPTEGAVIETISYYAAYLGNAPREAVGDVFAAGIEGHTALAAHSRGA